MTTYNATTYSVIRISTDLELYFELTRHTYTQDPEFTERWNEWIVDMVKERLWSYSEAVMNTELGNEIYKCNEDGIYSGKTLSDVFIIFAELDDDEDEDDEDEDNDSDSDRESDTDYDVVRAELESRQDDMMREIVLQAELIQELQRRLDDDEDEDNDSDSDRESDSDSDRESDTDSDRESDTDSDIERAELESRPRFTYKCRVECQDDIDKIMGKCQRRMREGGRFTTKEIIPQFIGLMPLPDKEWVFTSHLDLSGVRSIFGQVTDAHVALQTVQLEENYTGDRDYTLR